MNTKKALSAVMILLIILNIALAAYLISLGSPGRRNAEITDYTKNILSQRNISVSCSIPDISPGSSTIKMGDMIYDETAMETLSEKMGGTYEIDFMDRLVYKAEVNESSPTYDLNRTEVEQLAHDYIQMIGLQQEEFSMDFVDNLLSGEYLVRYVGIDSSDVLYFDRYVELIINEYGVTRALINIKSIIDTTDDIGSSLPVYTLMLSSLEATEKPMEIERISYGYHPKEDFSDESVMSWRIRFSDGSEKFFEVSTGNDITSEFGLLEDLGVRFETRMPPAFIGYETINYTDTVFADDYLESLLVIRNGQWSVDKTGKVIYVRTDHQNPVKYEMDEETQTLITESFITELGLDISDYALISQEFNDGIYNWGYIEVDKDGNRHYNNFIELQFNDSGVLIAFFRAFSYEFGQNQEIDMAFGNVLTDQLDLNSGQEYVITDIERGYVVTDIENGVASACWTVSFNDGTIRYLSVITGKDLIEEQ